MTEPCHPGGPPAGELRRVIVAEVTKCWQDSADGTLLSQRFEEVLATNLSRGYTLRDWRLSQVVSPEGVLTETIVAVFEALGNW